MAGSKAIRAGKGFIELFLDDDAIVAGLNQVRRRLTSFGSSIRNVGLGITAAGSSLAAPFIAAIKVASDLQETVSKFDVVFGQAADGVRGWGDEFAAEVGRSQQQILQFLASTQDLLVPVGIDPRSAEDLSKQITQLAVDLASFNNLEDSDALRDLQAALTGSGEVMKKYGVIVNETAVKQELLASSLDPQQASEAEKVMARLAIILRGTTAAQGDAVRTSDSFANQLKRLKAVAADTAAEIGNAVLPAVTKFVRYLGDVVAPIAEWVRANQELTVAIGALTVVLLTAGPAIVAFGTAISVVATAFGALATVVGLIGAPVAALVATFAVLVAAVVDWDQALGEVSDTISSDVLPALKALANAFRIGDFKLAAEIAATSFKLIWKTAINEVRKDFADFFADYGFNMTADMLSSTATEADHAITSIETRLRGLKARADREAAEFDLKQAQARESKAQAEEAQGKAAGVPGPAAKVPGGPAVEEAAAARANRAKQIFAETRTALEKYTETVSELNDILRAGDIDNETYSRGLAAARAEFERNSEAVQARIKAEEELKRRRDELQAEGESVRLAVRSPKEELTDEKRRLRELLQAGVIDEDIFGRAIEATIDKFRTRTKGIQQQLETGPALFGGDLAGKQFLSPTSDVTKRQFEEIRNHTRILAAIERNTKQVEEFR